MYVDVKVSVWQRIRFSGENNDLIEKIKQKLELLDIPGLWDIVESDPYFETLMDTEEYLTVEDNGGLSTVELYDDNDELIWNNGIEDKIE